MFFEPYVNLLLNTQHYAITADTKIDIPDSFASNFLEKTVREELATAEVGNALPCRTLTLSLGIPEVIKARIAPHCQVSGNEEEYAVLVGEDTAVYATTEKGLIFGLVTLLQLADHGELQARLIYDYPTCPVRGYRVYLPGRESIDTFKKMIDFLVYYKYNSLIVEIGGAMEYKKHPEINEKWVEFCRDMRRYSGRAGEIHRKYCYSKNSVHCDNGDGGFLSQDECRALAAYCRERGLEIIPECPTLSHCDYLLLPHPEFAERKNDELPDTYCPRHPGIYDYVFEVLDEVIDVFAPRMINIGHDEYYSICVCERCLGKDRVRTFIDDIEKINAHLKEKGVRTMMWGEKLIKAVSEKGRHYGGWYSPKTYPNGVVFQVPDMYECADKMPKDVTYLNWYWSFGTHHDRIFHDHGYPMLFGNFNAIKCKDFRQRIDWGCLGGFVSNWGSNEDEYMQRNQQYHTLIGTAYAFWSATYDSDACKKLDDRTFLETYRKHYKGKKNLIKVTHTTNLCIPYQVFYDGVFIEDETYMMGHYRLTYKDGTEVRFPVKYGTNIGSSIDLTGDERGDDGMPATAACHEVGSTTLPVKIDGKLFFECGFENPHPEKEIESFTYEPLPHMAEYTVTVKHVTY